jgi:ATP-dependent DNA helicase RecQ
MTAALCVSIVFNDDYSSIFKNTWGALKKFILKKVQLAEHTAVTEIVDIMVKEVGIGKYKAQAICEVIIASMDSYRKNFARSSSPIAQEKTTTAGNTKYQFNVAVNSYFQWVESGLRKIEKETRDGKLYLVNDNGNITKEYSIILGILEAIGCLTFEMIGGANSQLYIYVNQIQALKNILNAPYRYKNRLLDTVAERHLISVKMLTYLYESGLKNEEMWDLIEGYFLGSIPETVKKECKKENPNIFFD